ncbi:hypothetical protein PCE1_003633 [Barthelona sp. PCE]
MSIIQDIQSLSELVHTLNQFCSSLNARTLQRAIKLAQRCENVSREIHQTIETNKSQLVLSMSDFNEQERKFRADQETLSRCQQILSQNKTNSTVVAHTNALRSSTHQHRQKTYIHNEAEQVAAMVKSRNEQITDFVKDLGTTQDAMNDVAQHIKQHDELIISIEDTVTEVHQTLKRGNKQLVDADEIHKKTFNSSLCFLISILLFAVVAVVAVIVLYI